MNNEQRLRVAKKLTRIAKGLTEEEERDFGILQQIMLNDKKDDNVSFKTQKDIIDYLQDAKPDYSRSVYGLEYGEEDKMKERMGNLFVLKDALSTKHMNENVGKTLDYMVDMYTTQYKERIEMDKKNYKEIVQKLEELLKAL